MARPEFYEVFAVVDGVPISAYGWNFFDYPVIVFNKAPHVYYYDYERKTLERCLNLWYIHREKRICCCREVKDFSIHVIPVWVGSRG